MRDLLKDEKLKVFETRCVDIVLDLRRTVLHVLAVTYLTLR